MRYSFAIPILRNPHTVTALFSLFRKPYIPAFSRICFLRMFTDFFPLSLLQHIRAVLSTHTNTNYVLGGISTMTCYFGYFMAGFLFPMIKLTNLVNVQSRFCA